MNDDEINEYLALAMGWEKRKRCIWCKKYRSAKKGCSAGSHTWQEIWDVKGKVGSRNFIHVDYWNPAGYWNHTGIVIEWLENVKGWQMQLDWAGPAPVEEERFARFIEFGGDNGPVVPHFFGQKEPLTPRHIALAAISALNGEGDE